MIKVAIIGLDTSHATALPELLQDPATKPENKVDGMIATRCLRFDTPFQSTQGLDQRQAYLESIGVKVTLDFDEAVADCDAIMIEINDPAYHLEYFKKCAVLGKPIFLDKPFADNLENTRQIMKIARENNVRYFTASSLRFDVDLNDLLSRNFPIANCHIWGPVGQAAAGSSIIWYGVHAFEMLERTMGPGAISLDGVKDDNGYVFTVQYPEGRRGIVELTFNNYAYGALIRNDKEAIMCNVTGRIPFYQMLIQEIVKFFQGGEAPVSLEESFEIMAMLQAADTCAQTGQAQPIEKP